MRHYLFVLTAVGFMLVSAGSAVAGGPAPPCGGCGEVTYVEKTCYAPEWVTETRTVTVCEYAQEQREVKQIVNKCVPVQKQVQRTCTVMVPEQRTKTVQYTVCRPVVQQVERQYTVCVPQWRDESVSTRLMSPPSKRVRAYAASARPSRKTSSRRFALIGATGKRKWSKSRASRVVAACSATAVAADAAIRAAPRRSARSAGCRTWSKNRSPLPSASRRLSRSLASTRSRSASPKSAPAP